MLHVASAHAAEHRYRQGIDSLLNRNRSVAVYPNPFNASLKVESARMIRELVLYSTDGRLMKHSEGSGKHHLLALAGLQHGPYILQVVFDDGTKTSKMIIKQ